ncbi:putative membrane protein YphA (DoxX/SURF4 family) [Chryseobacterium vietnamense]|uniref:Membrane protein YphA (DoxX/SURF4 family) n=1 Tax=Chryseobacterium vietnamense TaxID=866785 RepID=A0ACC6J5P8_9FLAO|nr:DoxX family protein [Chryseobacterium vietnamense]MDR6458110.1 putative membrane protein YphA (DoxX/SURF4 family) [Chryseobacterium vietnamense]
MKTILSNLEKNTVNIYALCRILIGLFFFIAGFNKLFHPIFQGYMLNTISSIGFPFPQFTANFTAFCECVFGLFFNAGFLDENKLCVFNHHYSGCIIHA